MPALSAFRGIRYNAEGGHVDDVVCPPYDVIAPSERERLVARSRHNAVHLEVPAAGDGVDRYQAAAQLWAAWQAEGVLVADETPSFYAYRMGFRDEVGRPRQTTGILGELHLEPPGQGILPHERTTAKDWADRLDLLRATRANLSPIWALTPVEGLAALAETTAAPDCRATDDEGVHHRLWRLSSPAVIEAVSEAVATEPVLIADGHHRYEVALAYQAEVGQGGGQDRILALVVELSDEQLSVRPIHRLVSGLAPDLDLLAALEPFFDPIPTAPADGTIGERMADAAALALVTGDGTWLLRPRPETAAAAGHDLDSSRLDVALATLGPHQLRFQHGWDLAAGAVDDGQAQAAVLLRPATVGQIAAISRGGQRMPPKTTFFYPKLATGLVFRSLE